MARLYTMMMRNSLFLLLLAGLGISIQDSLENHSEKNLGFTEESGESQESCDVARLKCAYRAGCGMALQNYMIGCSEVMSGASNRCSEHCRNSLIALTSTEEGLALMKCKCGDSFCSDAKRRIDVCRNAVVQATKNSTTVSCSVAQWICMADPLCSTALDYYHRLCRSMFTGKKCTHRCNNSISILRRQEKAEKLSSCTCDGSEDFDCVGIRHNMDRLCFHKTTTAATTTTTAATTVETTTVGYPPDVGPEPTVPQQNEDEEATNEIPQNRAARTRNFPVVLLHVLVVGKMLLW